MDEQENRPVCRGDGDLISNLLAKGDRLRHAMISSVVESIPSANRPSDIGLITDLPAIKDRYMRIISSLNVTNYIMGVCGFVYSMG